MPKPSKHLLSDILIWTILLLLIPFGANADQRKVAIGVEVINTGKDTTDFHTKMKSDTRMSVVSSILQAPNGDSIAGVVTGDNSTMFEINWDVAVKKTEAISFAAIFTQEEKNDYSGISFFTPRESPTDVPVLGWRVEANGDVFLTNEYTVGIDFTNLLFQIPVDITTGYILALLDAPLTGTSGIVSSGTVAAGSAGVLAELLVAQFSFLNPGDFLTARLEASFTDPGFSSLNSREVLGHEHQVPEPTSSALLIIWLSGLFFVRQKTRTRNSCDPSGIKFQT